MLTFPATPVNGPLRGPRVSCCVSIALALCLAMAGTLTPSPRSGGGTRDRDRAVRLTRSGPFRFDSPDAILHSHEETKPDAAFSSLVIGQHPSAPNLSAASDAPHTAGVADTPAAGVLPLPGADAAAGLPPSPDPGPAPPSARPPARAPPFAA
jgi:hypothetical protein